MVIDTGFPPVDTFLARAAGREAFMAAGREAFMAAEIPYEE